MESDILRNSGPSQYRRFRSLVLRLLYLLFLPLDDQDIIGK